MKKNKSVVKLVVISFFTALLIKAAYELKWFDVLYGIYKVEKAPDTVQRVSLKSFAFVTKGDKEAVFLAFMASKNWQYIRRYGRGMLFEKDGYELLITHNTFFGRYAYYEVTSKSVFEMV